MYATLLIFYLLPTYHLFYFFCFLSTSSSIILFEHCLCHHFISSLFDYFSLSHVSIYLTFINDTLFPIFIFNLIPINISITIPTLISILISITIPINIPILIPIFSLFRNLGC